MQYSVNSDIFVSVKIAEIFQMNKTIILVFERFILKILNNVTKFKIFRVHVEEMWADHTPVTVNLNVSKSRKSWNNIVRNFTAGYTRGNPAQRRKKWRASRKIAKSRLKSEGAESVVVDKFPLRREAASWNAGVFRELLGRQLAIDFRPEEPRRALCRAPSPVVEVDGPGSCIPGGTILSGKLFRPCSRTRRYIYVSKLLVVLCRSRNPYPLLPTPQRASPDKMAGNSLLPLCLSRVKFVLSN